MTFDYRVRQCTVNGYGTDKVPVVKMINIESTYGLYRWI